MALAISGRVVNANGEGGGGLSAGDLCTPTLTTGCLFLGKCLLNRKITKKLRLQKKPDTLWIIAGLGKMEFAAVK